MKVVMAILAMLFAGLGYTGIKTAQYAHEHSQMVNTVHALKKERVKIEAEWSQLLLEQKMLADDAIINRAVRDGLDMHLPQEHQIVYLD